MTLPIECPQNGAEAQRHFKVISILQIHCQNKMESHHHHVSDSEVLLKSGSIDLSRS